MPRWTVNITDEAADVFQSDALTFDDRKVIQAWARARAR